MRRDAHLPRWSFGGRPHPLADELRRTLTCQPPAVDLCQALPDGKLEISFGKVRVGFFIVGGRREKVRNFSFTYFPEQLPLDDEDDAFLLVQVLMTLFTGLIAAGVVNLEKVFVVLGANWNPYFWARGKTFTIDARTERRIRVYCKVMTLLGILAIPWTLWVGLMR